MSEYRIERDSMGEVRLPRDAYHGPQTQRAVDNFPISGRRMPGELIHALGLIKWAAARVNHELNRLGPDSGHRRPLSPRQIDALVSAAREVAEGRFDDEFPIDVFQTGSGTSTNMNANEVIANRAIELSGGDRFQPDKPIHPNDHVNLGQSSNDVFPTAMHVAVARGIRDRLIPALQHCGEVLGRKSNEWQQVLKIGRTHLADATPISLGQEVGGWARQLDRSVGRAGLAMDAVLELPIGGTATGSGINTHPRFARRLCEILADETGVALIEAVDHFEANAQRDGLVECHKQLATVATTLFNVANNLRWLGSGPQCGFYEIRLPDRQPGSSIMPGKVNPVLCESLMQAAARALGNDHVVGLSGAAGGQFQLNVMMPVMIDAALDTVRTLSGAVIAFTDLCLAGMEANPDRCAEAVERSMAMATGLAPIIGYDAAAAVAKESFQTGKTVREICRERAILPEDELQEALDPWHMTRPR